MSIKTYVFIFFTKTLKKGNKIIKQAGGTLRANHFFWINSRTCKYSAGFEEHDGNSLESDVSARDIGHHNPLSHFS